MKGKFRAEFAGYRKLHKSIGLGLDLSNIRDEGNIPIARKGTVNITESFRKVGRLKEGDVLEFEAEVKEVAFERPKNVQMFERKFDFTKKEPLENFFEIKKEQAKLENQNFKMEVWYGNDRVKFNWKN